MMKKILFTLMMFLSGLYAGMANAAAQAEAAVEAAKEAEVAKKPAEHPVIARMDKTHPDYMSEECRIARAVVQRQYFAGSSHGGTVAGAGLGAGIPVLGILGILMAASEIANAYQFDKAQEEDLKRSCGAAYKAKQ